MVQLRIEQMIPHGKRIKLSALSVLVAGTIVGACHLLIHAVILTDVVDFGPPELVFSLLCFILMGYPGWIFAIPLVLLVKQINRRGFWIWLIAGSAVGPIVISLFIGVNTLINAVLIPTFPAHHPIRLPVLFLYCYSWALPVCHHSSTCCNYGEQRV